MGDENNTKAYVTMMMSTGQKITGTQDQLLLCSDTRLNEYTYWLDRDKRFVVNTEHIIAIRPAREEEISEAQAHGG